MLLPLLLALAVSRPLVAVPAITKSIRNNISFMPSATPSVDFPNLKGWGSKEGPKVSEDTTAVGGNVEGP